MVLTISLGICATNDSLTLAPLLSSIESFERTYEVIIVTSGSTDGTDALVRESLDKSRHHIIHIDERIRRGKWYALNLLFSVFSGNFLVLLPADVWATEASILQLVERLQEKPELGLVSGFPVAHPSSPVSFRLLWRLHGTALRVNGDLNSHATGELMAMRRQLALPLPPNTINDDAFLARRAVLSGWKVGVVPSAKVIIRVPSSIKEYLIQRERILLGHRQLRSCGGKSTTLRGLFGSSPLKATRLVLSELRSLGDVFSLVLLVILEMYLSVRTLRGPVERYAIWRRMK